MNLAMEIQYQKMNRLVDNEGVYSRVNGYKFDVIFVCSLPCTLLKIIDC